MIKWIIKKINKKCKKKMKIFNRNNKLFNIINKNYENKKIRKLKLENKIKIDQTNIIK
jgi:aspartyl/asparaginyl-tRNA synthetase